MVAWNKKIRIIISVSILLFIATLFLETKSPFGVRAEYYQLFGGEFELQFNTWWNKLKTSSKSKLPDSKFELEYTAKEDGLNLDRIRGGNLENLKKIPHGVIWSGYMYVTNPKDPIMNINYSGRIVVLLDNKLTYANIDEAETEKLSFSLKKDFIPFKIAFYTDNDAGDFTLSLTGKEGLARHFLTEEKIQTDEIGRIALFFKIVYYVKIISIVVSLCLIASLVFFKIYHRYRSFGTIPVLTKVFLGSFIFYFLLSALIQKNFTYLTGDEPHYLLAAHSIFFDHDVDLSNNYRFREYGRFFPSVFVYPHIKGTPKVKMASSHGLLLPLILAAFYGLLGKSGAILIMTIIMSINAVLLARLLEIYK